MLRDVEAYRKKAAPYIAATTHLLSRTHADLSHLRSRLQRTRFDGDEIPVVVQLAGLEQSIRRYQGDGRNVLSEQRGGDGGMALHRAG